MVNTKTNNLDCAFNPSAFEVMYPEKATEKEILNEQKKKCENELFNEIIEELENDLKNLGMDITYSSRILIGEVAMNLLFLNRTKAEMICRGPLREKRKLRKTFVCRKKTDTYPPKLYETTDYDYYPSNNEDINPLFDKLMPRLQKQINDGLKALGLLPSQTIERQKLVIVKKLRQQYENIETEYSVRAERKIVNNRKNNLPVSTEAKQEYLIT